MKTKSKKHGRHLLAVAAEPAAERAQKSSKACPAGLRSAQAKNTADMQLLGVGQLDVFSAHDGEKCGENEAATSRFSSCTAKTSPSTDNNSSHDGAWDLILKAKICQGGKLEKEREPATPTRLRACSDTTFNGAIPDGSSPACNLDKEVREVTGSARSSQKTSQASSRSKLVPATVTHSDKSTGKLRQAKRKAGPGAQASPNVNEYTGQRITTPYPGKFKTVICRFWGQGKDCPYGNQCNYAHGKTQLKQRDSPYAASASASKTVQKSRRGHDPLAVQLFPSRTDDKDKTVGQDNHAKMSPLEETKTAKRSSPRPKLVRKDDQKSGAPDAGTNSEESFASSESGRSIEANAINSEAASGGSTPSEEQDLWVGEGEPRLELAPISEMSLSHQTSSEAPTHTSRNEESCRSDTNGKPSPEAHGRKASGQTRAKVANIYSTILAGIQLTVRKTQSEHSAQDSPKPRLPTISLQEVSEEEPDALPQVWDAPELQLIKRLSCFEEICPSSQDSDGQDPTMGYPAVLQASLTDPSQETSAEVTGPAQVPTEDLFKALSAQASEATCMGPPDPKPLKASGAGMFGLRGRKGKARKWHLVRPDDQSSV